MRCQFLIILGCAALALSACGNGGGQRVGGFSNDLTGNEIVIKAVRDPAIPAIICHFGSFDRSFIDRISKGNFFEDPSNTAVDCNATGPIDPTLLATLPRNAEVFSRGASLFFKSVALRRIVDVPNRSFVYVSYSRELVAASAKLSMSVVALPQVVPTTPAGAATTDAPAGPAAPVAPAGR